MLAGQAYKALENMKYSSISKDHFMINFVTGMVWRNTKLSLKTYQDNIKTLCRSQ